MTPGRVEIILAPYHAGAAHVRVGRGPERLMREGLAERLRAAGAAVSLTTIEPVDAFEGEIGRSFEVKRRVSRAVAAARTDGGFPIVLSGNCNATVGVIAGLGAEAVGAIWFDAHPDFDTPEEATSGYFDGMGVATLTGRCWRALAASVPGFRAVPEERIVYCGIRDFEPGQAQRVRDAGMPAVYGSAEVRVDFAGGLDDLLKQAPFSDAAVHLDLDCLDTSVGQANEYAAPGGLSAADLEACMDRVCARVRPLSLTVASFNPDLEGGDRIAAAGLSAIMRLMEAVGRPA